MDYAIEDACEELSSAKDADAVFSVVRKRIRQLGFDRFSYQIIRPVQGPRQPNALTSYPPEWAKRYLDEDYLNHDPLIPAAVRRLVPYQWQSLSEDRHSTRRQRRLFREARDFGLQHGCTVPLHGPGGSLAIFSTTTNTNTNKRKFNRLWQKHQFDLLSMGVFSHEKMVELYYLPNRPGPFRLAPRERECLLWTSRGKTAWEVSEIIGVAEETAVSYLKSAAKRLGVHSKTHAVAKALMLGLIVP